MSLSVRALPLLLMLACAAPVCAAPFPEFDTEALKRGRAVWLGTCKDCHANPDSDAPQASNRGAWGPRLAKGAATLYTSALAGFKGPSGTEMPAKGGNPSLTDDEVKAAVDYMIKIASQP